MRQYLKNPLIASVLLALVAFLAKLVIMALELQYNATVEMVRVFGVILIMLVYVTVNIKRKFIQTGGKSNMLDLLKEGIRRGAYFALCLALLDLLYFKAIDTEYLPTRVKLEYQKIENNPELENPEQWKKAGVNNKKELLEVMKNNYRQIFSPTFFIGLKLMGNIVMAFIYSIITIFLLRKRLL